jgi:ATP-dependent exoDNAse (exonuclease V) alpha subunit
MGRITRKYYGEKGANRLTVKMESGRTITYDPARLRGVNVYDTEERAFAPGDRIQFTAKDRELRVVNRTMGTLDALDGSRATVRLDGGRTIRFDVRDHPHIEMAYALTSYVVQSETAKRSILYVDNTKAHEKIVNARTLYVGASRGVDEVIVVTDEKVGAITNLSRNISERIAMEPDLPQAERGLHI